MSRIHGSQIQIGTIPLTALSGEISGGGGGSGSTFAGIVIPFGFQAQSDEAIVTGIKSNRFISNSGYFVGWNLQSNVTGSVTIGISKTQVNGSVIDMVGTGNPPRITNNVFASGNNFVGWNSTGVFLGETIRLSVSNISGQITDLTLNVLNRNL